MAHLSQNDQHLAGDFFIDGFNKGNYTKEQLATQPDEDDGSGHDQANASSPEEVADAVHDSPSGDVAKSNSNSNSNPRLNPRSCVTCRKRKVRCNKHEPCSNCVKANIECIFPPPGRAPRKPRRPHDAELLKRLRRLESVVDSLGSQVDEDGNVHPTGKGQRNGSDTALLNDLSPGSPSRRTSLEHDIGRLLVKEGKSRYVSNEFWSSLGEEIAEIRGVLDSGSSEDEGEDASPANANDPNRKYAPHQGFLFGYASLMFTMCKLLPSPSQIFILWQIYKENVDPILKILHAPTAKHIIMKAAASSTNMTKSSETLFYSICFASVVSMTEDQCRQLMGESKTKLMQKYRFAVEQALSRADFLNSGDLVVLQALVMFLTCVKYMDTSRSIWALSGLAIYQAHAQGLHRDGTNFNLPPFDTEMRRRLWWHIVLLDARAAEDQGVDPRFGDYAFDTKMPLNVNDDDLWPDMTQPPTEQTGSSDMTFCLVRFELGHIQRKLRIMTAPETEDDKKRTVGDKEHLIDALHQHMQKKYFAYCDPSSPFLWVASTVGKLILAKMWLFIHHPRVYGDQQANQELKDQVFVTSVEVVEFGIVLEEGRDTAKWAWLFRTYMQWHAVTFVISELTHRSPGPHFDRGWAAIDAIMEKKMIDFHRRQHGALWKPLKQLYSKAKARRDMFNGVTASPHSNSDSNRSAFSETPVETAMTNPPLEDNWLGLNPYGNAANNIGADFDINFNDPSFDDLAVANPFNPNDLTMNTQPNPTIQNGVTGLPFGWTPEVGDFMTGFGQDGSQTSWQPQMQQEWH